ncbi:general secretion pathway protein GspB [Massilia sp. NR 4-1]|uniref:general secretion pathway protein GspB n=1 Tax=Massilia sp. NR 4-1 TaxID=1678028 RepID=UPI00067B96F9|nr:general secretion pathway protein GspB [Massilia sp. NR 4-1]AKU22137.1 hypothetical protein ACZ75_12340 [Massilia sp. NR 4-1]
MSYILEALQKAQAERQLGEAPTIHAPTLERGATRTARSGKRPLVLALVLMSAAVAGLLAMLLRSPAQPPAAQLPASAAPTAAPAPAAATPAAVQAESVVAPARTAASAVPQAVSAPIAAAPAAAPVPVKASDIADAPKPASKVGVKAARAHVAEEAGGKAPAAAAPAEQEERAQLLRELPEPIQRAIPQISMSGYMYSKNPADRLILIDKVLRREGEEVAPGLVLEKLQAKGAVFSFRGYRYRVPY